MLAAITAMAADLEIRPGDEPGRVIVSARPTPAGGDGPLPAEQGEALMRLALVDPAGKEGPAILGRYAWRAGVLTFTPRFPLRPGQSYRATLLRPGPVTTVDYREPETATGEPAQVERIYPTADRLPENLLRFYVLFSRPMRQGESLFDQIHILGPDGEPISEPWRRVELWSQDLRRLTLLIHPGRVKLGVNLREQLGPVLTAGQTYTLVIGAAVQDAEGRPLAKAFSKRFQTTPAVRERIDLAAARVMAPKADSTEPLRVSFARPLDRFLLERDVRLLDEMGQAIAGRVVIENEERGWSFQPTAPWRAGRYRLCLAASLEDLAGNTSEKLFEVDLSAPPLPALARDRVVIVP